ncbi:MAG: hypothetical protein ACOC1Z_05860 [Cyanobacteriota bacterium]
MQAALEEVLLNKGDLKRWVELDSLRFNLKVYTAILVSLIETPKQDRKAELNSAIQAFGDRDLSFLLELGFKGVLFILELLKWDQTVKQKAKRITLVNLLMDVKDHNQVIYRIHILDQLNEVGTKVQLDDRATVLEALNITQENIIKALKTERILRQNPGFKPENFAVDLASIRSLNIQEKSSEYGQLLNEALQIGVSLQDEIGGNLLNKKNPKYRRE